MRNHLTIGVLLALSLAGCSFLQSPASDDAKQVALRIAMRNAAFVGCLEFQKSKPIEAALVNQSITDAVLPMLAGDKPNLDGAKAALQEAVNVDPRILTQAFNDLEDLLTLVPAADQQAFYTVALTDVAVSCQLGLTPA